MHAWWSTQSRLTTVLSSLIDFRLYDGSHLKTSIDEMVGDWCFGCLSAHPGFPLDFFCSIILFFTVESLCMLYLFFIS